jgi:RimJ/RimL family protein N-acetyltransferase
MASLMAWSDLAVTAGGTTCWELAAMGVPFLVMILADNQVRGATAAVAQGMAVSLGWHRELSTAQLAAAVQGLAGDRQARDRLAARGRETVDGYGGTRVLHAMGVLPLGWRPTEPGDKRRVWEWANDPVARRASFRSDPIAWETHDAWFDRRLQNPNGLFMIAMLGDVPVGQARLDVCGQQGEISLCLRREFRGMGLGVEFIGSAGKAFFQARADARSITARVREDNAVSQRSFERAGYHRHGREEVLGHAAVVYELARQEAM